MSGFGLVGDASYDLRGGSPMLMGAVQVETSTCYSLRLHDERSPQGVSNKTS